MTRELIVKIEDAEYQSNAALEIEDTIIALSKAQASVGALLDAYRNAIINAEKQWQAIESRADFRAQYTDRAQAQRDYLKDYLAKH